MDKRLITENYERVRATIPPHVKLVAVSKTRTFEEIQALYDLGHRAFGENYPQELRDKHAALPQDIEWHFIGHLQTNKVKLIAPFVHLVHTVDRPRLLDELEKRAKAAGRSIDVLIQVFIAREETKHGLDGAEARSLIIGWDDGRWPHISPRGLMGMATYTEDREQVRREFAGLARIFEELRVDPRIARLPFTELSMGMSGDAELAIAEGSTMVRIGSAIFGERP